MKNKNNKLAKPCSMTGYGKAVYNSSDCSIEIEIKTLNNRHLDLNIKYPREYSEYELKLREITAQSFKRGRVDIYINRYSNNKNKSKLVFNENLFKQLSKVFTDQARKFKILEEEFLQEATIEILSRKDVLEVVQNETFDSAKDKKILFDLMDQALKKVKLSREQEGEKLILDIARRTKILINCVDTIKKKNIHSYAKNRNNLLKRVKDLAIQELDAGRLEQETALLVMRSDVTEETVRLGSHLETLSKSLSSLDGKKLEFTLQEILREFNTIGSKSNDIEITNTVIEAKSNIERIREQSLNIE